MAAKLAALHTCLQRWPQVVVLLSGGVDSSFLLGAASQVPGQKILALTFTGPHYPEEEVAAAQDLARHLGVPHRLEPFDPFFLAAFRQNTPERCYACKTALYRRARALARRSGAVVLDGTTADDALAWRPGQRAAAEQGIHTPLRDTGWQKADIRACSRLWGLPGWDRPPQSCLATRFPPYTPLSPHDLHRVDQVERRLRQQGFGPVRLRVHGDLVRLELPPDQWPRLLEPRCQRRLQELVAASGWRYLTLDLRGYQSGSMDSPAAPRRPDPPETA